MIIHDLRCKACGVVELDVVVGAPPYPACGCGGERDWVPARLNTDITGGPTYYASLDQTFASKSDLRAHLRENGLQEAGDRVGGARNQDHLHLGKTYSYTGQSGHTTLAESGGRRGRAAKGA